jgi:hypothetical protein
MQRTTYPVLHYHEYLGGRDSQTVHGTRQYCGHCRRDIGGIHGGACYGWPGTPDDLEAKNERDSLLGSWEPNRDPLEHYAFCPWCGVQFEDEWWNHRVIQNERVIDHFRCPGTHKGDTHEFRGSFEGHYLATTDPMVCWCEPQITPGLMGCVIRHQDRSYADYLASRPDPEPEEYFDNDEDFET